MKTTIIVAVVAAVLGIAVVVSPLYALGAAVLFVVLPLAIRRPFLTGVGLLAWGVFRYSFTPYVGANALAALELSLLAVVVISAILVGRRDHWLLKLRAPWVFLTLYVISAVISWGLNRHPAVELFAGMRGMLLLPALAVSTALLMDDPERQIPMVWKIAIGVALVQVPIVFYQYFFGGGATIDPDLVVGTLGVGGANILGVLMLAMMMQGLSAFFRTRRPSGLVIAVLAVVVIIMSSARLELLLAPICGAVVVLSTKAEGGVGRRILLTMVGLVIVVPILVFASSGYKADLGGGLDLTQLVTEQTAIEPGHVPRLAYVAYGWAFTQANSAFVPLGTGPGSAASGAAAGLETPEAQDFATGLRLIAAGSSSDAKQIANVFIPYPTQLTATLVENGVIGLVLYFGFIISLGTAMLRRCLRATHVSADPRVYVLWWGFMTLGTIYANPWEGFSLLGIGFFATLLFLSPVDASSEPVPAMDLASDPEDLL